MLREAAPASDWKAEPLFPQRARQMGATLAAISSERSDNIAGAVALDGQLRRPGRPARDVRFLRRLDPKACLALCYIPWRWIGQTAVIAIADEADIPAIRRSLPAIEGKYAFAQVAQEEIRAAIADVFGERLAEASETRCPDFLSCRSWGQKRGSALQISGVMALIAGIAFMPYLALTALLLWVSLMNFATMVLRAVALRESFRPKKAAPAGSNVLAISQHRTLPKVSVLIPLLREDVVLRNLVAALKKTSYPPELLDVKLVTEADDRATELALAQIALPDWVSILPVPPAVLRTKPRAMNYALDFCDGEIVGIYDAEDRPEPDQLRKIVAHLHFGPPDLACVQGYLDFYNAKQNWLSRCFTIEYAVWFRVLLGGVQRLGIPLPLGGTTVFFRRDHLEEMGGWDAHNVTEDADLGMRLARFGYRTEMVATTTMEEANCSALPWVKQRSRWLKGYAITWATHMRRPATLLRDLGLAGFLGFQVLFLGALTSYLATPLFWLLWSGMFGLELALWEAVPLPVWISFFSSMIIGQALMLAVAFRAIWAEERRHLWPTVLTLTLYWPLGAMAAYRAIFELFTRPFYWAKTQHGI